MRKGILAVVFVLGLFAGPSVSLGVIQGDVDPNPPAPLGNSPCVDLQNNMHRGSTDSQTGGDVTKLQDYLQYFLNDYFSSYGGGEQRGCDGVSVGYFEPSGTFRNCTELTVHAFQNIYGIFVNGASNGYVGQATRGKIKELTCGASGASNGADTGTPSTPSGTPTNLTASCNSAGLTTVSWGVATGATLYYPRYAVQAGQQCSSGWTLWSKANYGSSADDVTCFKDGITGTSVTFNATVGATYPISVYPGNSAGVSWSKVAARSFTCPSPGSPNSSDSRAITVVIGSGGTVSSGGVQMNSGGGVMVANGGDVTFTISPSSGYQIDTVLVDGAAITVTGIPQGTTATTCAAGGGSPGLAGCPIPTNGTPSLYTLHNVTANRTLEVKFRRVGAPTGLTASCNSAGLATMSWNAVSGATLYYPRYVVSAGASCASGWTLWTTDNVTCMKNDVTGTSATFQATAGVTYPFSLYSGNASGVNWNDVASGSFTCNASVTSGQASISGAETSANTVTATYANLPTNSYIQLIRYVNGQLTGDDVRNPSGLNSAKIQGTNSLIINSVPSGTYKLRVKQWINGAPDPEKAISAAFTVTGATGGQNTSYTSLTAPTGLVVGCGNAGTEATLSWNAVNGATLYYPRVVKPAGASCASGWTTWVNDSTVCYKNDVAQTSVTYTTTPGTTYSWAVYPGNAGGVNWSAVTTGSFSCAGPNSQTTNFVAPTLTANSSNAATVVAGQSVSYAWTRGTGTTCRARSIDENNATISLDGRTSPWSIQANTAGTFRIDILCTQSDGSTLQSNIVTVTVNPAASSNAPYIESFTQSSATAAEFTVAWSARNASSCTHHYSIDGGTTWHSWFGTSGGTTDTANVSGLSPGVTYTGRITCSGSSGTTPAVAYINHTVPANTSSSQNTSNQTNAPTPPSIEYFTQSSNSTTLNDPTFTVSWKANNASSCNHHYSTDAGATWQPWTGTPGSVRYDDFPVSITGRGTFTGRITCSGASGTAPAVAYLTHVVALGEQTRQLAAANIFGQPANASLPQKAGFFQKLLSTFKRAFGW